MTTARTLDLGQNVALNDLVYGLDDLTVGFGWTITQPSGPQVEVVPAVMLLNPSGKAYAPDALAFHNQLSAGDGAVIVGGDDEQVDLTLSRVPAGVAKLIFIAFVDPDVRKPGTFDAVTEAYIRLLDRTGAELLRFTIPAQPFGSTAVNFGELYRYEGAWKFRALGDGYVGGINDIAAKFGFSLS